MHSPEGSASPSMTPTIAPHTQTPVGAVLSTPQLPTDLLDQSRRRLRLLAMLFGFGFLSDFIFETLQWLTTGMQGNLLEGLGGLTGNFFGLGWCGTMLALTYMRRLGNTKVLTAGLVFQVGICLIVSLGNITSVWQSNGTTPTLTWATPVIIMFPLIVPSPPGRVLIASLASAMMAPLALAILQWTGVLTPAPGDFANVSAPPLIGTIFAFFSARVLFGLGLQVQEGRRALAREREMGSYRLESLIGRGGMGEVWKARHRLIARPAAIKLIRPEALGGGPEERNRMMDRFKREAEATASMRSPHTIEVYDFGLTDDGAFYYVMELLDGIDLETLVRRFGPVPPARVIHMLTQMCRSLGEAHERNLIHRDIKPANVFICRYGREDDFVKVLDFGLVKSSSGSAEAGQALTREHTALGTPAFMAPEQVVGQDAIDARTDIYAMGCVAYWLLTGVLVFDADSASKMMMQQVREQPVPASERVETTVPKELDAVVLRCLAKEPGDRPQSVDELSDALGAIPGARDWTAQRARAWWDAHLPTA